jgi:hypothetical protein
MRDEFYGSLPRHAQLRIDKELERIKNQRTRFNSTKEMELVQRLEDSISIFRLHYHRNTMPSINPTMPSINPTMSSIRPMTSEISRDSLSQDVKCSVIFFKDSQPYSHPDLDEYFPNQNVPLGVLLQHDLKTNPLTWECEPGMIRYFRIPVNNMYWVKVRYLSGYDRSSNADN